MKFIQVTGYNGKPVMINLSLLEMVSQAPARERGMLSLFFSGEEVYIRADYEEFISRLLDSLA